MKSALLTEDWHFQSPTERRANVSEDCCNDWRLGKNLFDNEVTISLKVFYYSKLWLIPKLP